MSGQSAVASVEGGGINYDAQDAHDARPVPALFASRLLELVAAAGERASMRFLEFFAATSIDWNTVMRR